MLKPLYDSIIFQFEDETEGLGFNNISAGGIIFKSYDHDASSDRYAKVLYIGDDCQFVKVGDRILVERLRWTEGLNYEGQRYWRTTEKDVMFISK
jgi:co-chaperonin GroES (HSP10)